MSVFVVAFIGLVSVAIPAHADFWGLLGELILSIVSLLGKLLLVIIQLIIGVAQYNDFVNAPAVQTGWVIVRDVSNMFFILVLLVIAFGTILKLEQYKYSRLLGKLIIMAVLINLSKFIAGFFIDLGQVVMLTFVNGFADAAAGNFTSMLQLEKLLTLRSSNVAPTGSEFLGGAILALALVVISIVVLGVMLVTLLVRVVILWILVVLSPLAYILHSFPGSQKYGTQWWSLFWKWMVIGPVLAFFIWLALTLSTANTGTAGPSPLEEFATKVDQAGSTGEQPQVLDQAPTDEFSISISGVSSSKNILAFMLSIGMLSAGLMATQQIGGIAGGLAGNVLGRIQKAGSIPIGAAAKLAQISAKGAAYPFTSTTKYFQRKMREIPALQPFTSDYWKGYRQRGEKLRHHAEMLAQSGGEYMGERMWKGRRAAFDRAEAGKRSVINAYKGDLSKELGKAGDSRQAMQDLARRSFYNSGHEGDMVKQAFGELATEKGNLDDVFFQFGSEYMKGGQFADNVREKFSHYGFNADEMFDEYNGNSIRDFKMAFLGIDKKYLDKNTALAADAHTQDKLRAMAGMSEAAKDVGHWEQYDSAKDAASGKYFIMDEQERIDEIAGEAKKRGMRPFLNQVAPHVFRQRKLYQKKDEFGNLTGEYDYRPDNYAAAEGTFEHKLFTNLLGGQHLPELRQMQTRISEQMLGKYFDKSGNFLSSDEEAVENGFEAKDGKSATHVLREDFDKFRESNPLIVRALWNQKFRGKPDHVHGMTYPWQEAHPPEVEPAELDKYSDALHENIHTMDVGEILNRHDVMGERDTIAVREELLDVDKAGRFGTEFVPREKVMERASKMQKNIQWDGTRYKPGTEARGAELDKEIEELKKQPTTPENKQKYKQLEEERGKIRGYWSQSTESTAGEIAETLSKEAREDIQKTLEGVVKDLKTSKGEKLSDDTKKQMVDQLMGLGTGLRVTPGPAAAQQLTPDEIEQQEIRDLERQHQSMLKMRTSGKPEERKLSAANLGDTYEQLNDKMSERRIKLGEKLKDTSLSDSERAAIEQEADNLSKRFHSAKAMHETPTAVALEDPQVSIAVDDMAAMGDRIKQALESSTGALEDFPKMADDVNKNLEVLVSSIKKASEGLNADEKGRSQAITRVLEQVRTNAAQGAATSFGGNPMQQRDLLWQITQLTEAIRKRRSETGSEEI